MKLQIVLIIAFVALATSEPPQRFNARFNRNFQFQKVEEAPYPPSGYRPAGAEFRLPSRFQPQTSYGPPPNAYLPPTESDDNDSTTENTEDNLTTTEEPLTTTTYTPARAQLKKKSEKVQEEDILNQGVYYIYHPNGFLQRVMYETKSDVRNMGYTAQLTYRDVEPIRDPVYTYDPETLVFQQIKL